MPWQCILCLFTALGLAALTSCAPPEQIRSYQVPRQDKQTAEPAPKGAGAYRIVGAVFSTDKPMWYFKCGGSSELLSANEKAIDQFFASLQFGDTVELPPSWKLPEGWKEVQKRAMTYAVIQLGTPEKPLEMTVSQVGGGLEANLKRWGVDQLGMPAVNYGDGMKHLTPLRAGKVSGYRVDLSGPNDPSTKRGPMMMGK